MGTLSDSTGCVDAYGRLCKDVLHSCLYEIPHSLCSCVLAINKIFGYCQQRKVLQSFSIPKVLRTDNTHSLMTVLFCVFGTAPNDFSCGIQSGEKPSNAQEAVHLILEKEAGGHLLSPAFLQLSPHQTWLAVVGRDGLLRICEISTMVLFVKTNLYKFIHVFMSTGLGETRFSETAQISDEHVNVCTFEMQDRYVQLQCHSCWQGGVGSVCFAPDSQTLITTGLRDGSLVCSRLR